MKKSVSKRPRFGSEAAERAYWQKTDSAAELDWSGARWTRFPNLRASTRTISLRLPESMLDELKMLANQRDIPYQSLLKVFLAERLSRERTADGARGRGEARSLREVRRLSSGD